MTPEFEPDHESANPFAAEVGTGLSGSPIHPTSPLGTDPPARELLAALGRLARDTRRALRIALMSRGGRLPSPVQNYLEGTLNHLGQVREGFAISLRTEACLDRSELRDLVQEILTDWTWMGRLGIRWIPLDQPLEQPLAQVLAFAHARAVLGALPRVPEAEVTFPSLRRSYADIPVPRSPGQLLERIDEIERVISTTLRGTPMTAAGQGRPSEREREQPVHRLGRDRLRRAYGFFETSAWLVEQVYR